MAKSIAKDTKKTKAEDKKKELRVKKESENKKVKEGKVEIKNKREKKESGDDKVEKVEKVKNTKEKSKKQESKKIVESKGKKTKSESAPQTMEELLEQTGYEISAPQPGEMISGLVTDISRKMVLMDIGAKTEGMVVDREFEAARDFIDELGVGDEVTAYVLTPENERGQILLSLKRALVDRKWQQYAQYLETGEQVKVKGLEVNKGGMIVMADGIRGFVPSSQFGKDYLGQMENLLDKEFVVKVIEVDKDKNRLIFSERHVSEADAIAKRSQALEYVEGDGVYEGVVSGIMPFGVFVGVEVPINQKSGVSSQKSGKKSGDELVGKVEGLVHISEISWEKVNDPNDYFTLGDRIKVKVMGVDDSAGKLNLSVKQLSDDPWSTIEEKYPVGAKVKGRITRTAPFGAFVTLEPGVDGLIHISKIPAGGEPKVDEEVEVFVESVDPEQRRMSLGMVLKEVPVMYK